MDTKMTHIGSNYLPHFYGSEISALSRLLPIALVFTCALFAGACSDGDSSAGLAKDVPSAFEGYVNKYRDLLAAYNKNSGGLSKNDWGKRHYCKAGLAEARKYPGLSAATCKSSGDGSSGESSNGGTFTKTDYQFVYKRNAAHFGGRTVRWASKTINVSG
ncbi:MAG: hypothetical protein QF414_03565, partial [Arenicellales bacterium]|nr:hypothetical protein [Arenicellales bacterium]